MEQTHGERRVGTIWPEVFGQCLSRRNGPRKDPRLQDALHQAPEWHLTPRSSRRPFLTGAVQSSALPAPPPPRPVGRPRKAVPVSAQIGPKLICSSSPSPKRFSCKQTRKGGQKQGGQRERLRHKENAAEGASRNRARGRETTEFFKGATDEQMDEGDE
eukprot:463199-Pelagomonas_calceolata.AAC.4